MRRQLAFVSISLILFGVCAALVPDPAAVGQQAADSTKDGLRKEREQQALKFRALQGQGKLKDALIAGETLLRLDEALVGKHHKQYLTTLSALARLHRRVRDFAKAEKLMSEASDGWKKLYGETHPEYVRSLIVLGHLQTELGKQLYSEFYYRRAYDAKKREGTRDTVYALAAKSLGQHYMNIGMYQRAEPLLKEAVAVRKAVLGPKHLDYTDSLNDLAALYSKVGRHDLAKPLRLEALAVVKSTIGVSNLTYTLYQQNLGVLYHWTREFALAKELFQEALSIDQKLLGPDDTRCAFGLRNLGQLAYTMGDYPEAERLLRQAAQIYERKLGKTNDVELSKRWLGYVYAATDKWSDAFRVELEAMRISQEQLRQVFSFSSEAGMFDYMATIQGQLNTLLMMTSHCQDNDPESATASLSWTLRRKGIILEALCQFHEAEKSLPSANLGTKLRKDLYGIRMKLANYGVNAGPEHEDQILALSVQAEEYERQLHRIISVKLGPQTETFHLVDCEQVRARLPIGSALVEFIRVRMHNVKAKGKEAMWLPDHYMAFVLTAGKAAPPRLFDLGPAETIDKAIGAFREKVKQAPRELRLGDEKNVEEDFRVTSSELYRLVFAPLRATIGKPTFVFLAPDSELSRIPFEALVDEDGKYLIEKHHFTYLLTGRDLLRTAVKPSVVPKTTGAKLAAQPGGTIVLAGPDYDLNAEGRALQVKKLFAKPPAATEVAMRGSSIGDTRGLRWNPLPGAAAEAEDVKNALQKSRYGPVRTYIGPQALEEVFKAIPPPRVLHIATHGFFLPETKDKLAPPQVNGADDEPVPVQSGLGRLRHMRNPMLRSGIVLAGANAVGEPGTVTAGEDGWVTAEEIALLNLRGTELVVLSACETGLGDLRAGQGVYGLRHAFLYAGARTLVTSLFEVPDAQTREIMKRFYAGLSAGQDKLSALHEAQLQMIRQRREQHGAAHPFFWASFVLVGDPK